MNGGGAIAALFLLRDAGHLPLRASRRGDDGVRFGLRVDLDVLALILGELRFEDGRLTGGQNARGSSNTPPG